MSVTVGARGVFRSFEPRAGEERRRAAERLVEAILAAKRAFADAFGIALIVHARALGLGARGLSALGEAAKANAVATVALQALLADGRRGAGVTQPGGGAR